jgi:hypothetical protein
MMTRLNLLTASAVAATLLFAQVPARGQATTTTSTKKTTKTHKESETERQIRELREKLAEQQTQLDSLKMQGAAKDSQLSTAEQSAAAAQAQANTAAAAATAAQQAAADAAAKADAVSSSVTDLKSTTAGLTETVIKDQANVKEMIESPSSLHYKGITITPVAFFAFEGVWRERSVNSDINTPFNSIPFPGASEGHTSELNFSGRQSRVGGLFTGDAGTYKLSGYFEADFLSAGTTSNNNQSNSYTLRQRQFWGKAETASGFAVTGGQMWSLVTETGKSTDARTEKLPNTIDPQYMVGFSWTRQPGIRLQKRFGDIKTGAFTAAMSLEQAQTTNVSVAGPAPANEFYQGAGQGGGLYNAYAGQYTNNVAPDVIVKTTYDLPKAHFELGGLARFMRNDYFPILTTTGSATADTYTYSTIQQTNTKAAGGIFASARVSPAKFVDVAIQGMAGTGTGRYGSGQLPDVTERPDGTLEPIKNYHALFSLETHPTPKLDVFSYYGGEYDQRTTYLTSTLAPIGYGTKNTNDAGCYGLPADPGTYNGGSISAPNCGSPTRYLQEGMIGFTYRLINSPKYGRLQYSATYQYIQRNLWSGLTSAAATYGTSTATYLGPRALDNMFHVGMRYYIP